MIDNKTLERIEKLFALGGSSNPHEAASATAMAQKLMEKHGIDSSDVAAGALGHLILSSPFSISKPKNYENILAWGVVGAFGGKAFWMGGRDRVNGRWVFVARKIDLPMVEHLFTVLQRRMHKGRVKLVTRLSHLSSDQKTKEGDGYCLGYAMKVREAIVEMASPVDAEITNRYVGQHLNFDGEEINCQKRKSGYLGYCLGADDGRAEKLHRPMTGESRKILS